MLKFPRLLLAGALFLSPLAAHAEAQEYKLDPDHTAVTFHISHFGFSSPSGKFMNIAGTLRLDEKNPSSSKITVTIPVDKINTGVPKLDEHLRAKEFFDTRQFPTATFVSDHVDVTGQNTANVTGTLTLHGVSKPVVLAVRLNKLGENFFHVQTAGFSASATLKRSDFGMTGVPAGPRRHGAAGYRKRSFGSDAERATVIAFCLNARKLAPTARVISFLLKC